VRSLAFIGCLAGCIDTAAMHEPDIQSSHVAVQEMWGGFRPKLDVLVVIDDSIAALPYEQRFATIAPLLTQRVGELTRDWMDVQIAVTGNDGRFRTLSDSGTSILADAWHFDYVHHTSFAGSLGAALVDLIDRESNAAATQPLEAMRSSLEHHSPFVRDGAMLAAILISANDDASPLEVAEYARWTRGLAGDDSGWARKPVAMIGIHPEQSPRLDAFYAALATTITVTRVSIDDDYTAAIADLRPRFRTHLGAACIEAGDFDATIAGTQYDCAMQVTFDDSARVLPACTPAVIEDRASDITAFAPPPACWQLVDDAISCAQDGLAIRFFGYNQISHPAYRLECRTR
jgi:hypothetical protein